MLLNNVKTKRGTNYHEKLGTIYLLCMSKYPVPVSPRGTKNRSCWDTLPTNTATFLDQEITNLDLYGTEKKLNVKGKFDGHV